MTSLHVQRFFHGPSILDMRPLLSLGSDKVTVAWSNTKPEVHLLRKYPGRDFILMVPDPAAMERAATTLGLRLAVNAEGIDECKKAFNSATGGKWRDFVSGTGLAVSRGALIQVTAHYIRQGHDPRPLRKLAVECLLDGTSAIDVDVLLGLRMKGAKV